MARPTIVIIGSAGSGKGTQAELIRDQLGYHVIEAGGIFRLKAKEDSEMGRRAKKIHESGEHAPDDFITDILKDYILSVSEDEPLLIDGYPRTLGQAKLLDEMIQSTGRSLDEMLVLWINVSREEVERRLLNRARCTVCRTIFMTRDIKVCPHCNGEVTSRVSDEPKAIHKRLDFFNEEVMPVIERYRKENKLIEINGDQEVVDVFNDIKKALKAVEEK